MLYASANHSLEILNPLQSVFTIDMQRVYYFIYKKGNSGLNEFGREFAIKWQKVLQYDIYTKYAFVKTRCIVWYVKLVNTDNIK